jgi:hypothetical protein
MVGSKSVPRSLGHRASLEVGQPLKRTYQASLAGHLAGWKLACWLAGWLGSRVRAADVCARALVLRANGWLAAWLAGWLADWSGPGWLARAGWVAGWLGGWLGGWLAGWLTGLVLAGWVAGWLGPGLGSRKKTNAL